MLNMTVELTLDWAPPFRKTSGYEIYIATSLFCTYDHYGERAGTVVNKNLTDFSQTFSVLVADHETRILVMVIMNIILLL